MVWGYSEVKWEEAMLLYRGEAIQVAIQVEQLYRCGGRQCKLWR